MSGNIVAARRLKDALLNEGVEVSDDPDEKDYDLLHVHTPLPPSNALEVRRAKKKGIPVVIHAHTTVEDAEGTFTGSSVLSGWVSRYLTRFYNMADLVLSPSEWTRSRLKARNLRVPIEVLSNGIDPRKFTFDQERRLRFRDRVRLAEDRTTVYMVGVVCLKKGVNVFPKVARQLPQMDFVWVGRRSRLYHPFKVAGAISASPPNVHFVYDVEDVVDAHCGGDIFFTPSYAENQGIALMEAMAVGRPVVARALPVYEGLLEEGKSALMGDSTADFVEALARVQGDEALSASFVREARESLRNHDIVTVAKRLVSIYDGLLGNKSFRKQS
jgi:1,2-diacylglycerol-3-alpha-glucose alpha-1,2-glucosyltransferase